MIIDELLRTAKQWGTSDVHSAAPACPMFRMRHEIIPTGHVCAEGVELTGKAR